LFTQFPARSPRGQYPGINAEYFRYCIHSNLQQFGMGIRPHMNINYYNITSTVLSSVYLHYWWLLFLCDTTTATIIMTMMRRMTRRMVIITQHNLREHFC